jgi:ActR/RegA family two-component response regulator
MRSAVELMRDGRCVVQPSRTLEEEKRPPNRNEYSLALIPLRLGRNGQAGRDLAVHIRASASNTRVLVFGGIAATDESAVAARLNVDGFLTRPLDLERVRLFV